MLTVVSRHIAVHLYNAVLADDATKFWAYFNQFWSVPESHAPAGWLWEPYVLGHELSVGDKRGSPLRQGLA